jgi:Fe-S-cluster containining protein
VYEPLATIYARIRARAEAVEEAFESWPCRAGCDHCCRHLYRIPEATAAEWRQFERGLDALDAARREQVHRRIAALAADEGETSPGQISCPALDRDSGRCLVYAHRPAACRSYGFYRSRAHDLWCRHVEAHVQEQEPARPVVWGNQDALESELDRQFGRPVSMTAWFSGHGRR